MDFESELAQDSTDYYLETMYGAKLSGMLDGIQDEEGVDREKAKEILMQRTKSKESYVAAGDCECENADHFDRSDHEYGMAPAQIKASTVWGTFHVCEHCYEKHFKNLGLLLRKTGNFLSKKLAWIASQLTSGK